MSVIRVEYEHITYREIVLLPEIQDWAESGGVRHTPIQVRRRGIPEYPVDLGATIKGRIIAVQIIQDVDQSIVCGESGILSQFRVSSKSFAGFIHFLSRLIAGQLSLRG